MNDVAGWIIGGLLLLAVVPHLLAYYILHHAAWNQERISALDERLNAARWWSAGSATIALLVINAILGRPIDIQPPWSQLVVGFALLAGSIPAVLFLYRYFTGGFRDQ